MYGQCGNGDADARCGFQAEASTGCDSPSALHESGNGPGLVGHRNPNVHAAAAAGDDAASGEFLHKAVASRCVGGGHGWDVQRLSAPQVCNGVL